MRFGYDGSGFAGWARQPGQRTVEGELRAGIVRSGIAPSAEDARMDVASRTDRGVHARGNALAISSELSARALLRALNGLAPDVFFTHARPIPEGVQVRRAVRRWYRYYEPADGRDLGRWRAAARRLVGTLDARSFGRGLPSDRPAWRTIESLEVGEDGGLLVVDVRAPSFVWGMVRKIVAALRAVDDGRLSLEQLEAGASGRRRLALPLAEPERLVLWEVEYEEPWEPVAPALSRAQQKEARRCQELLQIRGAILAALREGPPGSD